MTKAFAYLRVSGKGQVDGDGFPRQLAAIRKYGRVHGIEIVRDFRDEGVSGSKELLARPAFTEMMTALYSNGTRLVLIEKLDRLARDLMVQETIIADLRKHAIELISVEEPDLLQNDPTRKLMRQIFGAISEYEKNMIVLKLKSARERARARDGKCEGAKRFGVLPGEEEILDRMRQLRADGLGFDRIAARLNAEGLRPRRGKKWWGLTVNNILMARTAIR